MKNQKTNNQNFEAIHIKNSLREYLKYNKIFKMNIKTYILYNFFRVKMKKA